MKKYILEIMITVILVSILVIFNNENKQAKIISSIIETQTQDNYNQSLQQQVFELEEDIFLIKTKIAYQILKARKYDITEYGIDRIQKNYVYFNSAKDMAKGVYTVIDIETNNLFNEEK